MFEKIIKFITKNFDITEIEKIEIEKFLDSVKNSTEKLKEKLSKIDNKYDLDFIQKLKNKVDYDTNSIFIWRDSFQTELSLGFEDFDIDSEFICFINENDIYNPILSFENPKLENLIFDIYHSWIGYNTQDTKLLNKNVRVGITINGDIESIYFNDFSYMNISKFSNVNTEIVDVFKRKLTFEEIFIRIHLISEKYKEIELYIYNKNKSKNKNHKIFKIANNKRENLRIVEFFEKSINSEFYFDIEKCSVK